MAKIKDEIVLTRPLVDDSGFEIDVDVSEYRGGFIYLDATVVGDLTDPTLDVSVEHSVDGVNFFEFETPFAMTQLTDTGSEMISLPTAMANYIRLVGEVGGSGYELEADPEADPAVELACWDVTVKLGMER
jgi:hypothetical protein